MNTQNQSNDARQSGQDAAGSATKIINIINRAERDLESAFHPTEVGTVQDILENHSRTFVVFPNRIGLFIRFSPSHRTGATVSVKRWKGNPTIGKEFPMDTETETLKMAEVLGASVVIPVSSSAEALELYQLRRDGE